jgi:hypothetical protein
VGDGQWVRTQDALASFRRDTEMLLLVCIVFLCRSTQEELRKKLVRPAYGLWPAFAPIRGVVTIVGSFGMGITRVSQGARACLFSRNLRPRL